MSSLNIGDLVTVGKSDFPAQIVRFLDDSSFVQVKWLDSGQSNYYETIYPLTSIHPVQKRRNRVPIQRFAQEKNESKEKEETKSNATSKLSKKKAAARKRAKSAVSKQDQAEPHPPIKSTETKRSSGTKKSVRAPKKRAPPAKKPPPAKKQLKNDYSRLNGVARRPAPTTPIMDSDSDVELLAEARRMSQGRKSRHDAGDDDDRKPAAKSLLLSGTDTSSSSDSDSSDDEYTRATRGARKVSVNNSRKRPVSSKRDVGTGARSGEEHHKRSTKAKAQRRPKKAPPVTELNDGSSTDTETYESDDSVSVTLEEPATSTPIKQEETVPLEVIPLEAGDHVWIQDGAKHAAQVIEVVGDMLKVQWANGSKASHLVPMSIASRMFDLTAGTVDVGRPRRSTRSRHKPEMLGAVKKEEEANSKRKMSRKNKEKTTPRTSKPKRKKRKPSPRKTKRHGRTRHVVELDSTDDESEMEPVRVDTTVNPIVIDSSEDDSDADTEATFEFTAPRVDEKYRSRHVHSNVDSFMKVKPWEETSGFGVWNSRDNVEIKRRESTAVAGSRVYDVEMSPPPQAIRSQTSECVRDDDEGQSLSQECTLSVRETRSKLVNEGPMSDGVDDTRTSASFTRNVETAGFDLGSSDIEEEDRSRRESTETAESGQIRDILLQGDVDLEEANEERLTADSQDLTRAFASNAYADADLSTQPPEAMCT